MSRRGLTRRATGLAAVAGGEVESGSGVRGGIDSVKMPEALERIRIQVWPTEPVESVVVKRWSPET
jgi:hypothetical protein